LTTDRVPGVLAPVLMSHRFTTFIASVSAVAVAIAAVAVASVTRAPRGM
jgi:hypothetical protein